MLATSFTNVPGLLCPVTFVLASLCVVCDAQQRQRDHRKILRDVFVDCSSKNTQTLAVANLPKRVHPMRPARHRTSRERMRAKLARIKCTRH